MLYLQHHEQSKDKVTTYQHTMNGEILHTYCRRWVSVLENISRELRTRKLTAAVQLMSSIFTPIHSVLLLLHFCFWFIWIVLQAITTVCWFGFTVSRVLFGFFIGFCSFCFHSLINMLFTELLGEGLGNFVNVLVAAHLIAFVSGNRQATQEKQTQNHLYLVH